MSGFLYFIDGLVNPLTDAHISERELNYAFEQKPQSFRLEGRTPSGGAGTLIADEGRLGTMTFAYRPDEQLWRKLPGCDGVHVGYYKESKPSPTSLKRKTQLAGEAVVLADGHEWLAPRLRYWAGDEGFVVCLPGRAGLGDAGQWIIARDDPQYADLDALAHRLYAGIVLAATGLAQSLELIEALDAAARLLSLNYIVSRAEVGILEILPVNHELTEVRAVCRAAIDFNRMEEWAQKKTEANGTT